MFTVMRVVEICKKGIARDDETITKRSQKEVSDNVAACLLIFLNKYIAIFREEATSCESLASVLVELDIWRC